MNGEALILVVDDDANALFITTDVLREGGYRVVEARSAEECLRAVWAHRPDLVLLDVVLAADDGREVCRRIKSVRELSEVFVVLLSGREISSDAQADGLMAGADGYLVRPIGSRELLARVEAMLRIRRAELALRQSERLASLGVFSAGLAHEINNPMGAILLAAESAMEHLGDSDRVERALTAIAENARRCGRIVGNVLTFARTGAFEKTPQDLNGLVRNGVRIATMNAAGAAVRQELASTLPALRLNAMAIEQVVVNLVRNAILAGASQVTVRTEQLADQVVLSVIDDGCGMSEEQVKHVFDPFYTVRPRSGGTGLGLSVAYGIVLDHGGSIDALSKPGGGTVLAVRLPLDDTSPQTTP